MVRILLSPQEYEERLAKLQAEYNAEQESKAKLQEDIAALRSSYESKLCNLEKAQSSRGSSVTKNDNRKSSSHNKEPLSSSCMTQVNEEVVCFQTDAMCHSETGETSQTKPAVPCGEVSVHTGPGGDKLIDSPDVTTAGPLAQKHVLERLQQLEQEVVGGEQARNKELQQRQQQRKNLADQRKVQLLCALSEKSEESENVLLNVYNSIQEEVHAKNQILVKVQGKLKAAKLEIRDLQAEFEVERNDYLATIRRLEREGQLLNGLLERMVPLVRRDCNYSNLDRLKKEAVWDEDSATWRLPDVMVQKTTLPSAVHPKPSTRRGSAADNGESFMVEEDRYKEMLDRSDSENIASSYFKSKRASQLMGGEATKGHAIYSPPLVNGTSHLTLSSPTLNPPPTHSDSILPRPFRLESLGVHASNGKVKRKKSKTHIQNEGI